MIVSQHFSCSQHPWDQVVQSEGGEEDGEGLSRYQVQRAMTTNRL